MRHDGFGKPGPRIHREEHHPEATVRRPRGRTVRLSRRADRTESEEALIMVEAAESNRVRAEREGAERLAKALRS